MLEKLIHYAEKLSIFLITVALIVGMVGCGGAQSNTKPDEIWTWYDLDKIRNALAGSYLLMNDLDSTTPGYPEVASETAHGGEGWWPIGVEFGPFRGKFDGQGHEVRDLCINDPDKEHAGLFGYVGRRGVITNIRVVDVAVAGKKFVGGLVGRNDGTVSNSYSSGRVSGEWAVGGLVGWNAYGTVTSNSESTCNVNGTENVGGLVGFNAGTVSSSHYSTGSVNGIKYVGGLMGYNDVGSIVSQSDSTGSVEGNENVGGLVGRNDGKVSYSYSTASVKGNMLVGGLVGYHGVDIVNYSYSTGSVEGTSSVGGLVGYNSGGKVSDSYSRGSVNGNDYVGGLVGHNSGGIVSKSYSTGSVTGEERVGGLVGRNDVGGTVSNSFWDKETSEMEVSDGGTGKTTAEIKNLATFTDTATEGLVTAWDIVGVTTGQTDPTHIWNIINGERYPRLSWQPAD